jgi:hypothetical protein
MSWKAGVFGFPKENGEGQVFGFWRGGFKGEDGVLVSVFAKRMEDLL